MKSAYARTTVQLGLFANAPTKNGLPALQPHLYILTTITSKYPYLGLKLYMY